MEGQCLKRSKGDVQSHDLQIMPTKLNRTITVLRLKGFSSANWQSPKIISTASINYWPRAAINSIDRPPAPPKFVRLSLQGSRNRNRCRGSVTESLSIGSRQRRIR